MEAWAVIGTVSSVVQLIDFTGELLTKSVQIYRSSDGALHENSAIQLATDHLLLLQREVEHRASSTADTALQSLCKAVTSAAADLLAALEKLKVYGSPGKWKSIRKGLQSVWDKEEVRRLEHRLATFREELNLHVVVKIRYISTKLPGRVH
jgi:hypothetical protein